MWWARIYHNMNNNCPCMKLLDQLSTRGVTANVKPVQIEQPLDLGPTASRSGENQHSTQNILAERLKRSPTSLDISSLGLTDDSIPALADLLAYSTKSIRTVAVSGNFLTYRGLSAIIEALQGSDLLEFHARVNNLSIHSSSVVSALLTSFASLRAFSLSGNPLSKGFYSTLASSPCPELADLDLFCCDVGDQTSTLLATLATLPKLRSVNLWGTSLRPDHGLSALVSPSSPCGSTLESVVLGNNSLGDAGFQHLVDGLRCHTSVRRVDLSFCDITDSSMAGLRSILAEGHLVSLNLRANHLTPSSVKELEAAAAASGCHVNTLQQRPPQAHSDRPERPHNPTIAHIPPAPLTIPPNASTPPARDTPGTPASPLMEPGKPRVNEHVDSPLPESATPEVMERHSPLTISTLEEPGKPKGRVPRPKGRDRVVSGLVCGSDSEYDPDYEEMTMNRLYHLDTTDTPSQMDSCDTDTDTDDLTKIVGQSDFESSQDAFFFSPLTAREDHEAHWREDAEATTELLEDADTDVLSRELESGSDSDLLDSLLLRATSRGHGGAGSCAEGTDEILPQSRWQVVETASPESTRPSNLALTEEPAGSAHNIPGINTPLGTQSMRQLSVSTVRSPPVFSADPCPTVCKSGRKLVGRAVERGMATFNLRLDEGGERIAVDVDMTPSDLTVWLRKGAGKRRTVLHRFKFKPGIMLHDRPGKCFSLFIPSHTTPLVFSSSKKAVIYAILAEFIKKWTETNESPDTIEVRQVRRSRIVRARFDFISADPRMLTMRRGDSARVTGEAGQWLYGETEDGRRGFFPPAFMAV
ncbi:hypothetical protein J8273_1920 [Carpediemonas membranifera]|uniref:SH3 domain-containing protein n=1 Tax=Carpediemonas membranifera TaxID=201153 RepID=A0A8J6B6U2_9EUKA|nr:hypothetical protein J8273_1920 [Carpediemonas membranifera]|eukprot:KAG9396873.1 hypothetical protein J8273_1920 [Carpediemonas membranifera]